MYYVVLFSAVFDMFCGIVYNIFTVSHVLGAVLQYFVFSTVLNVFSSVVRSGGGGSVGARSSGRTGAPLSAAGRTSSGRYGGSGSRCHHR